MTRNGDDWNDGYGPERFRLNVQPFEEIWDPALLIAELWLEPVGRAVVAGRDGIVVGAVPRPTPRAGGEDFLVLERETGDRYDLVVDAERGILLRLEAFFEGERMKCTDVTDVTFDEPIREILFALQMDKPWTS